MFRYFITAIEYIYRVDLIFQRVEYLTSDFKWKVSEFYTVDSLISKSRGNVELGKVDELSKKKVDAIIKERVKEKRLSLVDKLLK